MEERPLLVTAAVIVRDGKVFLDRRRAESRFEPLKWEFPGGKVELGESPQDSLKRELAEELGIRSEIGPLVHHVSHVYLRDGMVRHVIILFYECDIVHGEPAPLEGGEIGWFDKEGLSGLELVEADLTMRSLLAPRLS